MTNIRPVKQVIQPRYVMEGAGVRLLRSISPMESNPADPFLLFDHFAFNDPAEGRIRGFPMHPHRGIETVTYMLAGSVQHTDSLGNSGLIGPGDVQWMTAGGGILHEEMPERDAEGIIQGFQLWVNLPAVEKMTRPNYQEIKANDIPIVELEGIRIRVVTGEVNGIHGPVTGIAAKSVYLEAALAPDSLFSLPLPAEHAVLGYFFEGSGKIGGDQVSSVSMVVFGEGEKIEVRAENEGTRFMLIAGAPFREPVAPYGPFVMNTREEIQQALEDLRNGNFAR